MSALSDSVVSVAPVEIIWTAQGVRLKLVVTAGACPGVIASARVVRRTPIVKMTWTVVVRTFVQKMTVDRVLMRV